MALQTSTPCPVCGKPVHWYDLLRTVGLLYRCPACKAKLRPQTDWRAFLSLVWAGVVAMLVCVLAAWAGWFRPGPPALLLGLVAGLAAAVTYIIYTVQGPAALREHPPGAPFPWDYLAASLAGLVVLV